MIPERTDYDEPGGRAWDGWPLELAGHAFAAAFVAFCAGFMAWVGQGPAGWWLVYTFGGVVVLIFIVASLQHEYDRRKATEAAIIANDARG